MKKKIEFIKKMKPMYKLLKLFSCCMASIAFLHVQAQMHMGSGDSLFIGAGEQLYINGNLDVMQGAVITDKSTSGINLSGTANLNGEINYGATGNQDILPYNHRKLSISGSGNKLLSSSIDISSILQLGGTAKLITGNYLLSLTGASSTIIGTTPFGSDASSWIVTGNGNAGIGNTGLGGLQIAGIGNTGRNGNILFPVGPTVFNYNPITVNNAGTTDDYTVTVNDQVVPGATINKSIYATWNITEASIGGSNVALATQWSAANEALNFLRTACNIVHSNGTLIDYQGAVAAATGSGPFTRSGNGFTSFSPFGVTSNAVVLAVSFISINAFLNQQVVQLDWEVAAENGILYYEVQRSIDNLNFVSIGSMVSSGNSRNLVAYHWVDRNPTIGRNYYRIRSIGFDAAVKYSPIATVNNAAKSATISVFPNPVLDNKITVEFKNKMAGVYTIRILSTTGNVVYQTKLKHFTGNNKYVLALPNILASQLYQMNIDAPDGSINKFKIMIQN
jgi:hypothetical protein